jgi:hypothetical protein
MRILHRLDEINAERRRRKLRELQRHEVEQHLRRSGHDDNSDQTMMFAYLVGISVAGSSESVAAATPTATPTFFSGGGDLGGGGSSASFSDTPSGSDSGGGSASGSD